MSSASTTTELPSENKSFSLDPRDRVAALFWGLMLLGVSPFLIKYCMAMWNQDLYQYFPFLLAAVFGLAYFRFDHRIRLPSGWWSRSTLLLSIAFLISAATLQSSWLGAIAFIFLTCSFLASLRGKDGTTLAYLAIPMIMFVRAPLLGTYTVMHRLQNITTNLSSLVLDVFGIVHYKGGHTIELVSKSLFVAEACSGVQSLFTMCFLSLLILVYQRRSPFLIPLYLALAFFFAIVGNMIRVTNIALAEEWFRIDLSVGFQHELIGYVSLAIAAGMLVSFDHLIGFLPQATMKAGKVPSDSMPASGVADPRLLNESDSMPASGVADPRLLNESDSMPASGVADPRSWNQLWWTLSRRQQALTGIAVACGAVMTVIHFMKPPDVRPVVATNEILFEPSPSFLGEVDAPIRVVSHQVNRDAHGDRNARHGMNSDVWSCGIASNDGQFVMSQPYMGWHELTICYQVLHWKMTSRNTVSVAGYTEPLVVADFVSDDGQYGCLVFSAVNSNGEIPRTPGHSPYARALAPFYPLIMDDFAETSGSAQTLMLQYWMTERQPISDEAKQAVIQTMARIRARASQDIVEKYDAQHGNQ